MRGETRDSLAGRTSRSSLVSDWAPRHWRLPALGGSV